MNLMEAVKTRALRIRNIVFFVMLPCFFLVLVVVFDRPVASWPILSVPLALAGLAVVLLTIGVQEGWIQKCFFLLAGASGAALAITLIVFDIMRMLGCTPGGDGGGITLPIILICPPLFVIGAVGAIVCLVRASEASNSP